MAEKDDTNTKLDSIAAHLDSLHKRFDAADEERKSDRAKLDAACGRMDSWDDKAKKDAAEAEEKAKKDADEEKAKKDAAEVEAKAKKDAAEVEAKAKKDADEKEAQDKAKKDSAAARDTDNAALRAELADLRRQLPAVVKEEDRPRFVAAQAKAETIYHAFGDSAGAPRWMNGEVFPDYQRRLLSRFQRYSPDWKDKDLAKVDASVLGIAEARIYQDAMQEARHPTDLPPNTLRKIERRDPHTDRKIIGVCGRRGCVLEPVQVLSE
jgi:hypothetical protein